MSDRHYIRPGTARSGTLLIGKMSVGILQALEWRLDEKIIPATF
jgi:hypothetical protein